MLYVITYWEDFGDNWIHQQMVLTKKKTAIKYAKEIADSCYCKDIFVHKATVDNDVIVSNFDERIWSSI